MFQKMLNKSISLILVFIIAVSGTFSFAYAEESAKEENLLSTGIEKVIDHLAVFARHSTASKENLYKTAFLEVFKEDPVLYEKVMKAILSAVDEHSVYFNEKEAAQFLEELNDEVTGIGVNVFSSDGNIIVSEPIPGSPAERVGVKAGDIIIGADDFDLRGMEFDAALEKIRGKAGTEVKIKLIRSSISEPLSFIIKREKVTVNPIGYEVIEKENKKIGYIRIYSFTNTVSEKFAEALKELKKQSIKNIIIDVRDNGGGYLDQAVAIADMFLPKDAVITTEEHKVNIFSKKYVASGKGEKYNVIMLVNGMSASASEVLTAALMENNAAKVIGEKTFGKGTVQTVMNTTDGGMMKYTSAFYLTPEGNNIDKTGITPTVKVENTLESVDMSQFDMFKLSKTYRIGDKGEEVELAKRMLKYLGIFIGEVNDIYDENLKIAVTTYQKVDGLFPYGVLDITTQMNLYDELKTSKVKKDDQLERAIDLF